MVDNYLKFEFPSLPQNVGIARTMTAAFAAQLEFNLAEIEEIRVAVSEAVSNCVIHGYPGKVGIVQLELAVIKDSLVITIRDFGKGIADINQAKQATFSTDPERMGLGLVFMESFMDQLKIISKPDEGTTVIMKKHPERGFANVGISRNC
ncbi:MAG: anti-sigma F factor [Firmicutes bacterium]|nr:anti-sigma F factor [Bacillota bacterium]